jgi:hypothetical protein
MGFRFSLQNANAVGHLVNKNVGAFLDETLRSEASLEPNIKFLENLISGSDFRSNDETAIRLLASLRHRWPYIRVLLQHHPKSKEGKKEVLEFLSATAMILSRCRVKTILLPGFGASELDHLMMGNELLNELVQRYAPGEAVLILQLKEMPNVKDVSLLNVFAPFETALHRIDEWPGVLIWNSLFEEEYFLKVESRQDIHSIYDVISNAGLRGLRAGALNRRDDNYRMFGKRKYAYLFHLSDLHFGDKQSNHRKSRLLAILGKEMSRLRDAEVCIPIITGDLMDSPTIDNKNTYTEFHRELQKIGFSKPIHLLGNHDVDTGGFIKMLTQQKAAIVGVNEVDSLEILDQLNLVFIRFNSNIGGHFAQGMVGEDQLSALGNELDNLRDEFTCIALLHHHPTEIENPDWYSRDWYEALLGTIGYEKSMRLVDSEIFLEWINKRGIKLILHGHKHIPNIRVQDGITIVAAGSATGKVSHKDKNKTYLSYNLIKYDIENRRPVSCTIIAEDVIGSGAKNVLVHPMS